MSADPDDNTPQNVPRQETQEVLGQVANVPSDGDDDDDTPDTGGYFEFVNPRALQAVNEDDGDGDDDQSKDYAACATSTAATVQLESDAPCLTETVSCLTSSAIFATAIGDASCGTFDEAFNGEEDEDFGDFSGLSAAEVEAVVQGSLRQLQREHAEVSGPAAAADEPLPVPAGLGAEKAAKLVQLRAALAAARAARTAGSGAVHHPEMELSPGADEFPEDYDALQAIDSSAFAASLALSEEQTLPAAPKPPVAAVLPVNSSTARVASSVTEADFDPFGTGDTWLTGQRSLADKANQKVPKSGRTPAAAAAPAVTGLPLPLRRPVSPLASEVKAEIRSVMANIKITPRGGVPLWTERVVQAALLQADSARSPPLAQASAAPAAVAP